MHLLGSALNESLSDNFKLMTSAYVKRHVMRATVFYFQLMSLLHILLKCNTSSYGSIICNVDAAMTYSTIQRFASGGEGSILSSGLRTDKYETAMFTLQHL